MLYEPREVEFSEKFLARILRRIKGKFCLLGGWATYQIVNQNFESINGRKYIGSRDIDIGFHVDKGWSERQLRKSDFFASVSAIEEMGFTSIGFRLVKRFEFETGKELTAEEAAKLPLYQILHLYIDPIVDYIHPRIKHVLGFIPIDEPLLTQVFEKSFSRIVNLFGRDTIVPEPHVMLAMKLNSVTSRDKEYKRIKDMADIYALIWYSDVKISTLKNRLFSMYPRKKATKVSREFSQDEIQRVSSVIGVEAEEIQRAFGELR